MLLSTIIVHAQIEDLLQKKDHYIWR